MAAEYEVPALFGAAGARRAPSVPPADGAEVSPSMRFMSQLADGDVDEAQVEAALSDFPSFRRADAEGSLEAVNGVPATLAAERRVMRRRVGAWLAAIAVLALASLLVDPQGGLFDPGEVLACYDRAIKQVIASVVAPSDLMFESDILAAHPAYFRVLESVGALFATVLCGAAVCVGGLLFQASFQREYAVVPVAGVSAAVLAGQGIALLAVGSALGISWVALLVACLMGFAPVVALRFRLNALALGEGGARQLGVDIAVQRRIADGCAVVLLVVAQVHAGPVFPLAIAIPPLARRLFGTEFRKALAGSALLGVASLLLAHLIPLPTWAAACIIAVVAAAFMRMPASSVPLRAPFPFRCNCR